MILYGNHISDVMLNPVSAVEGMKCLLVDLEFYAFKHNIWRVSGKSPLAYINILNSMNSIDYFFSETYTAYGEQEMHYILPTTG